MKTTRFSGEHVLEVVPECVDVVFGVAFDVDVDVKVDVGGMNAASYGRALKIREGGALECRFSLGFQWYAINVFYLRALGFLHVSSFEDPKQTAESKSWNMRAKFHHQFLIRLFPMCFSFVLPFSSFRAGGFKRNPLFS